MLAKETGLTALLFNIAFDIYRCWSPMTRTPNSVKLRWKGYSGCGRVLRVLAALTLLASVRLVLLQGSLPTFSPQDNPPAFHPSFAVRLMTFCYLAAFNWWLLLCPWSLSHDWQMGSIPLVTSGWDPRNLVTVAAFVTLLALSYTCLVDFEFHRHTPAVAGMFLLVIPYLPASNLLVTVGFVVAERVLYIPSVGFVITTLYGIQLMWRRASTRWRKVLILGIAMLVVAGVARTYTRNRDWRTRETLLRSDLAVLPHNAKLHYNFANFLKDVEDQENAILHYKEALKLWPSYASAHNNLGTLVIASGKAEHHFLQALKYNRDHVNAHYNLAKLYRKKNRMPEAMKMIKRCIALEPGFVQAYLELLHLKPIDEKKGVLDKILKLEPKNWEHYLLYGNWLKERGVAGLSAQWYWAALRVSLRGRAGAGGAGGAPALRAVALHLRQRGQRTRLLHLLTRWVGACGDAAGTSRPARAQALAARALALRLRRELAGRAALYHRPAPPNVASTCLDHSQLEVSMQPHKPVEEPIRIKRTLDSLNSEVHSITKSDKITVSDKNCQRNVNPKKVSISAQYKPIHNKSEIGMKRKSCPINKKKKIKEADTFSPFVSDHLIKTY